MVRRALEYSEVTPDDEEPPSRTHMQYAMQSDITLLSRAKVIIVGPKVDLQLLESIHGTTSYRNRSRTEIELFNPCCEILPSVHL
jgi:hypothetical protein